jgi:hypothetical protein
MKTILLSVLVLTLSNAALAKDKSSRKPSQAGGNIGKEFAGKVTQTESYTKLIVSDISCSSRKHPTAYTLNVYAGFAPGSRLATNVSGVRFVAQPKGTASIEKEFDSMRQEEIFDSAAKASKFYLKREVVLNDDKDLLILNLAQNNLKIIKSSNNGYQVINLACTYTK